MENKNFGERWEQSKEKIKEAYPEIKEQDLRYEPGKEEELLERLQQKLKKTKKEIRNWLHLMG